MDWYATIVQVLLRFKAVSSAFMASNHCGYFIASNGLLGISEDVATVYAFGLNIPCLDLVTMRWVLWLGVMGSSGFECICDMSCDSEEKFEGDDADVFCCVGLYVDCDGRDKCVGDFDNNSC